MEFPKKTQDRKKSAAIAGFQNASSVEIVVCPSLAMKFVTARDKVIMIYRIEY